MDYLLRILPPLLDGAGVTLGLFVLTLALSLPLGLALALARLSRLAALRGAVSGFIWLMRGTPLMLQLLVRLLRPALRAGDRRAPAGLPSAVVAFTLNYAAYFAEILRAASSRSTAGSTRAPRPWA
jgi:polar amino acid transport system permease protein